MRVKTEQITSGEEEIIIKYKNMTPQLQTLIGYLKRERTVILGKNCDKQYRLEPGEIYYFESVEEKLFACTRDQEYQVMMTLAEADQKLEAEGFFRCNKSFVVNIDKIAYVKSEMGNRIDAVLDNGEHIMISRHYARQFRSILKGGNHA